MTINFFKLSRFFVYLAFFSFVLVNINTLFPFIVTKYTFFRGAVWLALIFFLLGWFFFSKEESVTLEKELLKIFKSPLVISVSVFVLVFLLAGFVGFNPAYSFWSNFERGEGGFQLLSLYLWFFLLMFHFRSDKEWKKVLAFALAAAGLMIIYGIFAHFGIQGFIGPKISSVNRFQGSLGNPIYVGTYLMFAIAFAVYLLAEEKKNWRRILLGLLAVFYLIFFWLAQVRGAFLGLAVGGLVFLIYLLWRGGPKWRPASAVLLIFILVVAAVFFVIRKSELVWQTDLLRWLSVDLSGSSFKSRLWTWGSAIMAWQERPIFGWGPENFPRAFDKYFNPGHFIPNQPSETWYDRAHSVLFDYLAETGLIGLLSYLAIFIIFYVEFFKRQISKLTPIQSALLFALPAAYLAQGLFIFDVLPIYINLFLFLALAARKLLSQEKYEANN